MLKLLQAAAFCAVLVPAAQAADYHHRNGRFAPVRPVVHRTFTHPRVVPQAPVEWPQHASIVMDAANGDIIEASNDTVPVYPASLTKLMTLHLIFNALDRGAINLDSPVPISANAAAQPPTKLGVAAGRSITVEEAIDAMTVHSSNDVATAVAELLGGTEARFAEMMTQQAFALGMTDTVFGNASGLPDGRNVTTARDMAILTRAMVVQHPILMAYLGTPMFAWQGRTWFNSNPLLTQYPGVIGGKTGWIRASGFNLMVLAVRGCRKVIGVVVGGRTSRSRDVEMMQLLDHAFDQTPGFQTASAGAACQVSMR